MQRTVSTANAVWIAAALLHKENPQRSWFASREIEQKAIKEGLLRTTQQTLRAHISQHCVANKPASPDTHRKLLDVGRGRRRLFVPGDRADSSRARGRIEPFKEEVDPKYHSLIDWFREEYVEDVRLHASAEAKAGEGRRFEEILNGLKGLTPEERRERAQGIVKAVIAFERRRQKQSM